METLRFKWLGLIEERIVFHSWPEKFKKRKTRKLPNRSLSLVRFVFPQKVWREFVPLSFHNTYICSLIRLNLKETVLWIGVLSHDLHWENKLYKLKSSVSRVSRRKFIGELLPNQLLYLKRYLYYFTFLPIICDMKFNSWLHFKNFLVNSVLLET